ncbi:nucleotide sugar dehydrogenase [Deinococcus ruber]|uniref:UDP-N-acetyl-D-galactosamine dehydrogenase n=1 Tax=Deinococcus ruber TaxID=1848197 RepID=A0A918KW05_9DEIO|nr:nucleotide sugar dehydrogenase [Deinococcus ruber]GGR36156.1 UDP-N-acetyl-D-galactosamine dehydrogenase [Deinococcus ruber]
MIKYQVNTSPEKIAIIGLGYVGLPLALELAKAFPDVVGFDILTSRIQQLANYVDRSNETDSEDLKLSSLSFSSDETCLVDRSVFIVTVPTPIDEYKRPDLSPLISASRTIGKYLKEGDLVIYESTVYPGVTEEICGAVLEEVSGLKKYVQFKLGYSPERINPGDKVHTLRNVVKVVSAQDEETLNRVCDIYGVIVEVGLHRASTIKVAEAAKVIENTQRDLNIALVNELAIIFDRMDISTLDVLEAAGTKWNFLPFRPGLVGGHCIGVDPYYLTQKAQEIGYTPEVILAGRRVNDSMGVFVAQKLVKMLTSAEVSLKEARVGILGLTYKEDVPDLRNSRIPDIVAELREFGIDPLIHDPLLSTEEVQKEYHLSLCTFDELKDLDGLILAVPHQFYLDYSQEKLLGMLNSQGIFIDVKSVLPRNCLPGRCWSL